MKQKVIIGILGFIIAIIIFLIFNGINIQENKPNNSKLEIAGCQKEEIRLYYELSNKNIYTYDIELIRVNQNGKYVELKDILSKNENYIEEFIENMEYVDILRDGGTKVYKNNNIIYIDNFGHKEGFYLYECNTLDGSKDIYIGSEKLKDYNEICMVKND